MKRLLLLGAGPAHLHVMRALAAEPLPGAEVTLVSPWPRAVCPAMLAGHVAGDTTLDECSVALAPLAERAGARLLQAAATGLDAAARSVALADGRTLAYDALSLDLAATMERDAIAGAREHGLFLRPAEVFAPLWQRMLELAERQALCVVVVGAGAPGVEMALALQRRLGERSRVSLVGAGMALPGGMLRSCVLRALRRARVALLEDECVEITAQHVRLAGGTRVACDAAVIALPQCAPAWLGASGLLLDEAGFVAAGATLQSRSHAEVFTAGAVGTDARGAGALALNLRRFLAGGALTRWTPPARRLELLASGERRAIAAWGGWAAEGRWAWRWKRRHERAWLDAQRAHRA
ncbi:NAD(P)/FAD-dependent oxidoreductase [Piscinibacter sp.]|uniref:NAD(P)/FAD-dependent oxidoreductase n=1 Tax=Piscinibacter sp. TaxID=1903157 RepID=UPI0039E5B738